MSIRQLRQLVVDVLIMMRFAAVGATATIVLLGAAAVSPHLPAETIVVLLIEILLWHGFVHIANDLIDYDIDRTQAVRVDSPLVKGRFSKQAMLLLGVAELAVCLLLSLLAKDQGLALMLLLLSLACMTIYNIWGKRARMPLLTDAIQGVGWGSISLFGAAFAFGRLTPLNLILFLFFFLDTFMISGIHANLRDLSNDLQHGVLTTAIWLGARPAERGRVILSRSLIGFGVFIQLALNGLVIYTLLYNPFRYEGLSWILTMLIVALLTAYTIYLGLKTLQATRTDYEVMLRTGLLHLLMLIGTLIAVFAMSLGLGLLAVLVCAYVAPLFTSNVIPKGAMPELS